MVFSSIPFLFFFLPLFLILYFVVPFKYKNYVLLIFSLIFYAWGEPIYILLMIFSSVVDYFNGLLLYKNRNNSNLRKRFLIVSVCVNLGLLGFFKYSDFLINSINHLFGCSIPFLELGLPIGISFYTFQTMSYTIDVYRGEVKPERNFWTFMTYVSMFPQLIAGPIVRYETVSKELYHRTIDFSNFANGFVRFLKGLFKKVLIANQVGYLWSVISSISSAELSIMTSWLGIIAFGLQIYFDFSGYSDMAIGIGRMLGFHYLENFDHPYVSHSITEFWRRWHISLSSWFRDYVYIPLGGSRVSKVINIRNILIVWSLTGLWHGASWNFVLWGLYFGIILIFEKCFFQKYLERLSKFWQHTYTIIVILVGWLLFAFDDIGNLVQYGKVMFGIFQYPIIDSTFIYYLKNYFWIIVIAIMFSLPTMRLVEKFIDRYKTSLFMLVVVVAIILILFVVTTAYLVSDTYNPFLYFRF